MLNAFSVNGTFYTLFIDPLLAGIRKEVASLVGPGESVIDIACGTGALSLTLARHAGHVTGLDLSEDMVRTARRKAERRKLDNTSFEVHDVTDLSVHPSGRFDVAVTSMAMHPFDRAEAVKVLSEMKRIARRVIVADYACPMPPGPAAMVAWGIECLASGDHYRNFKVYMKDRGLTGLAETAGLGISRVQTRGFGVLVVVQT
ncbi:MAG: class I SAM-dependent methyltransferase [Deltaproteobacteria bacterium]|nr:class I SAM-dependent methyltransferase [Deltaproteobacteria bacterium]